MKCEYEFEGKKCKEEGELFIRGLTVCRRHYNLLSGDNKYRSKHALEIPERKSDIIKRVSRMLKVV